MKQIKFNIVSHTKGELNRISSHWIKSSVLKFGLIGQT